MLAHAEPLAALLVSALPLCVALAACAEPTGSGVPAGALPASTAEPGARRKVVLTRAQLSRHDELLPVTDDRPDPEAQRQFQAHMGSPAIALSPASAPPKVTLLSLDDTRRGEAPRMTPASEIFSATLAEGQRATMPVKIPAGACETFIAQGGIGVIEVDLFLTGGEGDRGRVLAEDAAIGPIAVLGGHGRCLAGAPETGSEAVLHAAVRRGAGVVLVRAYQRPSRTGRE